MSRLLPAGAAVLMLTLPALLEALGQDFHLVLATRILVYALAATSLNLLLGYGGMVSFGHAVFIGIGGYAVAILASQGLDSAWISWPIALLVTGAVAWLIGSISLRTSGVHFLMITLALAQMFYCVFVSLSSVGGDDGLQMDRRSSFGFADGWPLRTDAGFYYTCLAVLMLALFFMHRLLQARFGMVLIGLRENAVRMGAIGYPTRRYKLLAFVIAGLVCGLAGVLNVELNRLVSPSMMHWTQSGTLIVMVILGGPGRPWAGVVGAALFLGLEELITHYTEHWQLPMGLLLLALLLMRISAWRPAWLPARSAAAGDAP
ncbi:branched-chain amino acid ABC transporter permease [Verminephrobacter aporrectodeae subsp. tuberculatae]|uniref:Branched-chain amino acid ABC transporter permease n=1 Tax=Verminephrobacter aporrectodeae subsp. tuberculatae TaxID=1110392 RepID=A0ABT3KTB2_9BURK|nr:branched-chain amino acid ABC transporter permease [Verminephrobacter aporrectodeae]MCW5222543.1 branched-chain amino acid ABC transporter permease [Verminephrobacter aporrectodeae subsp. tuberculatae]MCW5288008.1 branched-chain amino acid ABC transporter permease [Verminephrobacter aporrectodeae subsp. tuberculatae]MCW5321572.1 branched-chain amino acid ABC transporter permease [Verminephrobacter aporrectodeae subsp. tuberculatae]